MGNKRDKPYVSHSFLQQPHRSGMDSKNTAISSERTETTSHEWKIIGTMPFLELPQEVILHIFSFMSSRQLCEVAKVCRFFDCLSKSNEFWEPLFRRDKQVAGQICLVNGDTTSWKMMYKDAKIFTDIQDALNEANATHFRIILAKGVFIPKNGPLRIAKKIEIIGVPFLDQTLELFEEEHAEPTKESMKTRKANFNAVDEFKKQIQIQYHRESEVDKHQSVIRGDDFTTIIVDEGDLLLKNVVVRQTSNENLGFAIDGIKGKLRIENCQVSAQSLSAIILRNDVTFEFVKSHISHGGQAGIYSLGAATFISDSTIEFTQNAAVLIQNNSPSIKIVNTTIRNCLASGIFLQDLKGIQDVLIENCLIRNSWIGIRLVKIQETNLRVTNNRIDQIWAMGIYIRNTKGNVIVEKNVVSNSAKTAIWATSSDCIFRENRVLSNSEHGLKVEDGKAEVLNNSFEGNLFSGMDVYNSYVVAKNNQMCYNNVGVYVFEKGTAELIGNDIHNNKSCGVEVRVHSTAKVIKDNKIHHNGTFGVYIVQMADSAIEHTEESLSKDNRIFANVEKDVFIEFKEHIEYEIPENFVPPIIPKNEPTEDEEQKEKSDNESKSAPVQKKLEPSFDVRRAMKRGICTFSTTGHHFHEQFWWHCETCNLVGNEGVCIVCKDICHKGHQLTEGGFSAFFCDCGATRPCKALEKAKPKKQND
jgi:parallel beta-helix repeat protein